MAESVIEPKPSTRERIIEICRGLFNERGPASVTTAEIAQAACISEGNLHYHFRRKEQIVVALFEMFEAALERVGSPADGLERRPDPQRLYLSGWFNVMWEWRFLYAANVYRLAPALQPRLKHLSDVGHANIRRVLNNLVDAGKMRATPDEIERLVVNAWIVSSYWIDYLRSRQGVETVTREHLRWGFAQVEALFMPYVVEPASAEASGSYA